MKNTILSALLALFILPSLMAQTVTEQLIRCGTNQYEDALRSEDPDYDLKKDAVFEAAKRFAVDNPQRNGVVFTIPVVFHIVYNTSDQNITDAQVMTQLDVLNKDFRKTNDDAGNVPAAFASIQGDAEIEFCIATKDPNGNPTTGITRTTTNTTEFETPNSTQGPDPIKSTASGGRDAWPSANYLNVWICNLGGGVLGYATFPGTTTADKDGVVIGHKYLGDLGTSQFPYNRGRTTTHEVGHWLGLRHIWGDGPCGNDDGIGDTPTAEADYGGCPSHPQTSCNTVDMFMNYMDYVDDRCMNSFTNGQIAVMRSVLQNNRSGLITSANTVCSDAPPTQCQNVETNPLTMGFESGEDFSTWLIENANNDNRSWQVLNDPNNGEWGSRTGDQFIGYLWSTASAADDWVFSPCIAFQEGHTYEIKFWYASSSDAGGNYPEKLEVGLATTQTEADVFSTADIGEITNAYPNFQEGTVTFSPTVSGEYTVGFHCYSDADQYVLNLDDINIIDTTPTSTEDAENESIVLEVYPNPASDQINLSVDSPATIADVQVRLIDVSGKVLIQESYSRIGNDLFHYDVSDLSNGVYFLNITTDEGSTTKKVVVSK